MEQARLQPAVDGFVAMEIRGEEQFVIDEEDSFSSGGSGRETEIPEDEFVDSEVEEDIDDA
jgi:hypothetical protein